MKNIKHLVTLAILAAVFMVGTTSANAGLLVSDFRTGDSVCVSKPEPKADSGILVTFTGILVTFTGILVTFSDNSDTNCAVIIHD